VGGSLGVHTPETIPPPDAAVSCRRRRRWWRAPLPSQRGNGGDRWRPRQGAAAASSGGGSTRHPYHRVETVGGAAGCVCRQRRSGGERGSCGIAGIVRRLPRAAAAALATPTARGRPAAASPVAGGVAAGTGEGGGPVVATTACGGGREVRRQHLPPRNQVGSRPAAVVVGSRPCRAVAARCGGGGGRSGRGRRRLHSFPPEALMAASAAHCFLRRAEPPPPPTPPRQARHRSHPHPVPPVLPSRRQCCLPPALPAGIDDAGGRQWLLKGGAATVGGGETATRLQARPRQPGCRRSIRCCGAADWAGLVHVSVAIDLAAFRVCATITSPRFVRDLRDTPAARIGEKSISAKDAKPFDLHGRGARSAATAAEQPISMPTGVQRSPTRFPPFNGDYSVRRSNASDRVPGN